jgi:hypothetical protein
VDTTTDEAFCGDCTTVCPGAFTCCASECIDTAIDENHCGACGDPCPGTQECEDSMCVDAVCCGDEVNDYPPILTCDQVGNWIAFEYVPDCDYVLARIELHTNQGTVALLADNAGQPGAILFQGTLDGTVGTAWRGADTPSIALTGGQTYWVVQDAGPCSVTNLGTFQNSWSSINGGLAGPWTGPWNFWQYTAHLIGDCQ